MKITYGQLLAANAGGNALSKIGSKDRDVVKALAKMLIWIGKHTDEFYRRRDTYTNQFAERVDEDDDQSEIKVRKDDKGETHTVWRNKTEYDLALGELLREEVKAENAPPPFTDKELALFKSYPDAATLANLGPFVNLD